MSVKSIRRVFAGLVSALALAAGTSGMAHTVTLTGPFLPGYFGALDDSAALLVGGHPGDTAGFADSFVFTVSSAAGIFATTLPLQQFDGSAQLIDSAAIAGIALFDLQSNVLASDSDGSDGFSFSLQLPSAGNYALVIAGLGGEGQGRYVGLLSSVSPVDEPTTALLVIGGLAVLARQRRRRDS